ELSLLAENGNSQRKVLEGYTLPILDQFISIVAGTTIVAYSLYTFSAPNLPTNHAMMLTIPFVLYGIFRYLYLIHFDEGESPEDIVLSDVPIMLSILGYGAAVLIIFYIH
ncbi:MAG: decaprenyl-phosphate phosphoribosyltransferase, partial [Gammaproteobacteria bacterium]|nr:decaprenyl-phosphate phosphoribosyltransferase [Gammaproteobacteria bacterium]